MKKKPPRISMEDHRKAIGNGCTAQEYAERLGFDEAEAKRQLGVLRHLPAITIDKDGKIRWIS